MNTRIVSETVNKQTHYIAQYRPWWSPVWFDIRAFYRSDFTDMPGWWSNISNTIEDAERTIVAWKAGNLNVTRKVIQ